MKQACAYRRVSGKGQLAGDGFERQRIAIEEYAAANGIEIVHWFDERGVSGTTEWGDRPGWSEMMATLNGVRTIVVESLHRVARAILVQELILSDLKKRGVELLTADGEDSTDDDPTRVMFRQILGIFSQYEKTMLVLKLRGARQRKKTATGRCEGIKPFGELPGETETLAYMRRLSDRGMDSSQIAVCLNVGEHPTRHRKRWHSASVTRILQREGNRA